MRSKEAAVPIVIWDRERGYDVALHSSGDSTFGICCIALDSLDGGGNLLKLCIPEVFEHRGSDQYEA